ncbi:MAG: TetR/AcrR family transcriptional regulator [Rhodocyclaceae bacterium]
MTSRSSIGPTRNPESHRAILDAASTILAESGYGGFTMDAVAQRAGASKRTLYRWWRSKAALIIEVYLRESSADFDIPDRGSVQRELVELCQRLWRMWSDTSCGEALRSLIAEGQHDPASFALLRDQIMPARLRWPGAIIERGIARGEIPANADTAMAIELLTAFNWYRLTTNALVDDGGIERVIAMVVAGLQAVPAGE